jgi:hypothetical protein
MYIGDAAIDYLITQVNKDDPASSSHWKKYHSKFDVRPEGVIGIEGFGSNDVAYRGIRRFIHWFLQIYFKSWALKSFNRFILYNKFNTLNENLLKKTNQGYSSDFLRQTLTLTLLNEKIPEVFNSNQTILIIGDGFANMTNLIYQTRSFKNIILVNLSKTLLVDALYIKKCIGVDIFNKKVKLITESNYEIDEKFRYTDNNIYLIEAKNHEFLASIPFGLVINIASMQEMDKLAISRYFEHIQNNNNVYFYCCNREEKFLPDGTIIRFKEYPWKLNDEIIVDELCPWHQKYYEFPWPVYKNFDGPIIHQLRKMNSK